MNSFLTSPHGCGSLEHVRYSRRGLLKAAGAAGIGWLTPLSQHLAMAAETGTARPRSVIILWLQGGASQLETFDPHPGKEIAYGGKAIDTAVKGLQLADGYEQTAEWMKDLSVIRSLVSVEGDHSRALYNMKTGHRLLPGLQHPSLGAVICHELEDPGIDIPSHISILSGNNAGRGGYLGAKFDAFKIGDPVHPIPDVSPRVPEDRQERRLASLDVLETTFANGRLPKMDEERTQHQANLRRALEMMTSDQLKAFDVSVAPKAELDSFGDSPFGHGCLAAVRLVESGVRCVEVALGGWDTHANNQENQRKNADILDPAIASLVRSLKERDLFDETVVIVGTEFGRTPKLNAASGRDHWPHGFSILMGGGGIAGGRIIGETDPEGKKEQPVDKVKVADIHATVQHVLGIDYESEIMTPIKRPIPLSDGTLIKKLLA